jgi:hypothetical protein
MRNFSSIGAITLAAALLTTAHAQATDQSKYPDWNGQWVRAHPRSQWDPSKPRGLQQQAPLIPEYQEIFEIRLKALRSGRLGADPQIDCLPSGMPRMMIGYEPLEFIVTPEATYIRTDHMNELRRIHTNGRAWPAAITPTFEGYSIGRWIDEDGDGRYDALEVETRGFKGPRTLDADGLPLHKDNRTIVKERIYLNKDNRKLLHAEITTIDNAFTHPWTVKRDYRYEPNPVWPEYLCTESNNHVRIGKEVYFRSADGHLMPSVKDQPPPDLKHFNQPAIGR